MEFTINIKCDELVAAINRICDVFSSKVATQVAESESKKIKTEATRREVRVESETEQAEEPASAETEIVKNDKSISIEEVRAELAKLSKEKGKETAKYLLSEFDVSKVTELEENQYADFLQAIKEA